MGHQEEVGRCVGHGIGHYSLLRGMADRTGTLLEAPGRRPPVGSPSLARWGGAWTAGEWFRPPPYLSGMSIAWRLEPALWGVGDRSHRAAGLGLRRRRRRRRRGRIEVLVGRWRRRRRDVRAWTLRRLWGWTRPTNVLKRLSDNFVPAQYRTGRFTVTRQARDFAGVEATVAVFILPTRPERQPPTHAAT